jgi:hypothetical protein
MGRNESSCYSSLLLMVKGGGYSTTSTIRAIYGSVSFEKASNLHAGLCGAKSGRKGGSGARCSAASPLTMVFPQLVQKKRGNYWGEKP